MILLVTFLSLYDIVIGYMVDVTYQIKGKTISQIVAERWNDMEKIPFPAYLSKENKDFLLRLREKHKLKPDRINSALNVAVGIARAVVE